MKRQPTEWEKIFANDVTNKGIIFKSYKQLMWLNIKKRKKKEKAKQSNQKMGRGFGLRDCQTQWSRSNRGGEIWSDIIYMWNLERNETNEVT